MLGESVSIDTKIAEMQSRQPPVPFFTQANGMGNVITAVDRLAAKINTTVFGRTDSHESFPAVAPESTVTVPVAQAPAPSPVDASPEIWRSPYMDTVIDSLAIDDVDDDGRDEIVALAGNKKFSSKMSLHILPSRLEGLLGTNTHGMRNLKLLVLVTPCILRCVLALRKMARSRPMR